jgi:hypothetical protein
MEDLNIYGRYTTVTSVDPHNCFFIARYPDGSIRKGNNLFDTGWDDIPQGLTELSYVLSTGHVITFPRYKAYLPLIECSVGLDGSRVFHALNVKCLEDNSVAVWRVLLKQDTISNMKIGDIILSREPLPERMSSSWKFTS